jgi:hypothetical protein
MSYDPTLAMKAREAMDARFEELQTIQRKIEGIRQAEQPLEHALHVEWTYAYGRFQAAYEAWKAFALASSINAEA